MPFHSILVAYDGSAPSRMALRTGIELAAMYPEAEVHVLYVSQPPRIWYPEVPAAPLCEHEEQHAKALLDEAEAMLKRIPGRWRTLISEGRAADEILAYAAEARCSLIVMGSRGRNGLKGLVLGSVSHHVVQRASIPVLVIK